MIRTDNIIPEICEHNKRTLPLYFPPPISIYLHYITQLSILLAYEKTTDWFYSNFIQLYSDLKSSYGYLLEFYPDQEQTTRDQFFLRINTLDDSVLPAKKKTLIENIINWINNRYYISVLLSESEIPGTYLYKKRYYPHFQFLFGYDLSKKEFKLLNFNPERKLSIINLKFKDIVNALFSEDTQKCYIKYNFWHLLQNHKNPIRLYKFLNDVHIQYPLDIDVLKTSLEDYIHCKNTSKRFKLYNPEFSPDGVGKWGLDIYQNLIEYMITKKTSGNSNLDIRPFHGIWEHKIVMQSRLEYLQQKGFLDPSLNMVNEFNTIKEISYNLMIFGIKSNYRYRESITNRMIFLLESLYNLEKVFFDRLLEILSKSC